MPKNKFNEMNAERKRTIQEKQNNNSLVIKQNQGPLVPPQGLQYSEPYPLSCCADTEVAFLIVQLVKNSPAMQETLVRFLGQEDLLEKG